MKTKLGINFDVNKLTIFKKIGFNYLKIWYILYKRNEDDY